jgi:hypothetical protein
MITVFLFVTLSTQLLPSSSYPIERDEKEFISWIAKFNKVYSTKDQYQAKRDIFLENLK